MSMLDEYITDLSVCSAFIMEGLCDYEFRKDSSGECQKGCWDGECGKDQFMISRGIPVAKIVTFCMQFITYKNLWDEVKGGVFHYEVTTLVGYSLAAGKNDEELREEIIDLVLEFIFGEDVEAQEACHPELVKWVYRSS